MNESLRICLWMLGGGVFGSLLGGSFGAIAAAMYARNGGAAGTRLARNAVENFLRVGDRQPSPTFHAALIGAADGFFFMGGLGLVAGALLAKSGLATNELLVPLVAGSVLMVGGAILFGSMAYGLRYYAAEFLYVFASTSLCGFVASSVFGSDYCVWGIGAGPIIGLTLCRASRAYSPKFHPPRLGKTVPQPRSDAETGITGIPPSSANEDFFPKPDSFKQL